MMLRSLAASLSLALLSTSLAFPQKLSDRPEVAITFDDLPLHSATPPGESQLDVARQLLDTMQREHLPPVFGFVNGVRLEQDPSLKAVLEAWRADGNPLGNHAWSHMNLNEHPLAGWEADVEKNEPVLRDLMGRRDWHWLRYPNLGEGDTADKRIAARQWLDAHGYRVAEVTLEHGDYLWNAPYARCMEKRDDAAVQRLHDTYLEAARKDFAAEREDARTVFGREIRYVLLLHMGAFDARMFPELIAQMRSEGFRFVTLEKAEKDKAYSVPAAQTSGGGTFTSQVANVRGLHVTPRPSFAAELDAMCR